VVDLKEGQETPPDILNKVKAANLPATSQPPVEQDSSAELDKLVDGIGLEDTPATLI
jgi:hypothetical protein